MKQLKLVLIAVILALTSAQLLAQKTFYGSITYQVKAATSAQAPSEFDSVKVTYYTNNVNVENYHSKLANFYFAKLIVATDSATYALYDAQSNTAYYQPNKKEYTQTVAITSEVATILGHPCQKYLVSRTFANGITSKYYWWVAKDLLLGNSLGNRLAENSGCILKREILNERKDGKPTEVIVEEAVAISEFKNSFDLNTFLNGKKQVKGPWKM